MAIDPRFAAQSLLEAPAPILVPWAVDHRDSRGRLLPEKPSPTRTDFQRDRDRIIHSTAFRRLAQKTQVFVPLEADHFRTRLTHSMEVAQIARAIARSLRLDDDLAEAIALAHDLGHTPFGHTGEDVLDACMASWGGFDHNAQALRIVTRLERRYAGYDGLNLSWETLEGLVKHNGPLMVAEGAPLAQQGGRGVPAEIVDYNARHQLDLGSFASAEAQCAAIADDIAYNTHDIDDALRAGLLRLEDLRELHLVGDLLSEVEQAYPGLESQRSIHEIGRRLITRFVEDVIKQSLSNLQTFNIRSASDVRAQDRPMVAFSPVMAKADRAIKAFMFPKVYRHERVMVIRREAAGVVERLFHHFMSDPSHLPIDWACVVAASDEPAGARMICDYIAGMTDRYALAEHKRLFGAAPELR